MKNKKSLLCISAIMIFIFHLWIPLFNEKVFLGDLEQFIRYICYIGVDIFFFISAYSLAKREIDIKDFFKNRFVNIYLKFILFALIVFIYKNYEFSKLMQIIIGLDFFKKGGGSFLWFIPAIMVLYLVFPFFKKFDQKHKIVAPVTLFIGWLILSIVISLFTNYKEIFIFTNRIPIFMIGYYLSKYDVLKSINGIKYYSISILLFILGTIISYFVYINHFSTYIIYDLFYILNIPLILGLIFLIDKIPNNIVFEKIGNVSLELYGFQMIFGFKIASKLLSLIGNKLIVNLLTLVIILILSMFFNFGFKKVKQIVSK